MREIKIRAPKGHAARVSHLAAEAGIRSVASHEVYAHGPDEIQDEVKVKSSTPQTREFLSALLRAPFFDPKLYSFSAHDVRALISEQPSATVTKPVCVPFSEIQQDFWQYSHITPSFVIRTMVSAGLLAYAMIKDDTVLAIGSMIFTTFSPLILTTAFALVARQKALVKQGLFAFFTALGISIFSAAGVAHLTGGPLLFSRFGSLSTNVLIAAITGLMAAVADADDIGRRQLLGLAMAYPFVKFPIWVGISLAIGFPEKAITCNRFAALGANAVAMMVCASLAYWTMGRHGELKDLPA